MSWKVAGVWPDGLNAYTEPCITAWGGWLYMFGGFNYNTSFDAPNLATFPIQSDGSLGQARQDASPLCASDLFPAMSNGYLYVANPYNDPAGTSNNIIQVFRLTAGKVLPLPQFTTSIGATVNGTANAIKLSISGNYLFLLNPPTSVLASARLGPDGSISSAFTPLATPTALSGGSQYPAIVSYGKYLFWVAGQAVSGSVDQNTIYRAEVVPSTGDLIGGANAWKVVGGLTTPRDRFACTVSGTTLLVTGGQSAGTALTSTESFTIYPDGSLSASRLVAPLPTPQNHAVATAAGQFVFAGLGYGSGNPDPNIYVARVTSNGDVV